MDTRTIMRAQIRHIAVNQAAEKKLDDILEQKSDASLESILRKPEFLANEENLIDKVIAKFNENVHNRRKLIEPAWPIQYAGVKRIEPGSVWLSATNQVPELTGNTNQRMVQRITLPTTKAESFGIKKLFAKYYGAYGTHVINVPPGEYAKAMSGNTPLILNEGIHVIHDKNLTFNPDDGFDKQYQEHIHHNVLHIIRVPQGKYAKITVNKVPRLLPPSEDPYVYEDRVFSYDGLVDQDDYYINHKDIIHIVRVPQGYVVKAWNNNLPLILESRDEPYVYESPIFRVEKNPQATNKKDNFEIFFDATENKIEHGQKKRLIPPINKVFIINDDGKLDIVGESKTIDDPKTKVIGMLPTSITTLTLPTKKSAQKAGLALNSKESKMENNFEYEGKLFFQTRDSLQVATEIVLAYQLTQPKLTVSVLAPEDIESHIESVAISEMGKIIQSKTSQELTATTKGDLSINHTAYAGNTLEEKNSEQQFGDEKYNIGDIVRERLASELREYGIDLIRFTIGTFNVTDKEIRKQIAEQATLTAKTNTKLATLTQETEIATKEAERQAKVSAIQIEQDNRNKISQSEAAKTAAQNQGEAILIKAEAEARAKEREAKAEAARIKALGDATADAIKASGEAYEKYVSTAEIEKTKLMSAALKNANITLTDSSAIGGIASLMGSLGVFKKTESIPVKLGDNIFEYKSEGLKSGKQ